MASSSGHSATSSGSEDWPGRRLGRPREGAGSIARLAPRIVALVIDWGIAAVIAAAFFGYAWYAILAVFAVSQIAGLATAGGSLGHLIMGLRLERLGGGYSGLWRPVVRTALLCLVIPAAIYNADQRGAHDLIADTVLVKR